MKLGLALVAPGGYAVDPAAYARGLERLSSLGLRLHNYYDPDAVHLRFGGTDAARVAQLHDAIANPDVDVILALRGSYGVSRILADVDFQALADSGKILVGYSDITALHLGLLARTGACSYAGPMLCDDFTRETVCDYTMEQWISCTRGPEHRVQWEAANNPALHVEGQLWGGNLAMVVHLLGTPLFPQIENGILFLEDVGEHPYRVERMLLQLHHAGVLARQRAVVLGAFNAYKLGPFENGYDFDTMLAYLRERLPLPVLTGLPFGHIAERATLPVGARCELTSDGSSVSMTMRDYPVLPHV